MARVVFSSYLDDMCGKVLGRDKVIFCHRGNTVYTRARSKKRTGAPTADELERRARFSAAVKATYARMQDPQHMAPDVVAWRNQTRYETLYGYVFSQVYPTVDVSGASVASEPGAAGPTAE